MSKKSQLFPPGKLLNQKHVFIRINANVKEFFVPGIVSSCSIKVDILVYLFPISYGEEVPIT